MLNKIKEFFNKSPRFDNWSNLMTNLGARSGRVNSTRVARLPTLDMYTLEELYNSNGLAERIINVIVDDAMKYFIEADHELLEELSRINAKQRILDGCYAGRLYGGAIIVAFIEDGLELDKPVNEKRINKIISLRVFDRWQVTWNPDDLNKNYGSEYFGEPEYYTVSSFSSAVDVGVIRVHRSRCFLINGAPTTNRSKLYNGGWDKSVMQSCFASLRNYGIVTEATTEIVQDFIQVIFKMEGLAQKMVQQGGAEQIKRRADYIDTSRSAANSVFIDSLSEDYEKKASSVAGLADLWDRYCNALCSVTGYPATKLFGISPAGLNSTGDSDLKNYYDMVGSYRSDQIQPIIQWIINLLENQSSWEKRPKDFNWEFPSLITTSDIDTAKIKKEYAEIDCMYIDRNAINPIEAWQQRFGQEKFNFNIQLSPPKMNDQTDEEKDLLDEIRSDALKEQEEVESLKTRKIINDLYNKIIVL